MISCLGVFCRRASNRSRARFFTASTKVITLFALALILSNFAWAQVTEKVLYSFQGGSDGSSPLSGLISDSAGNLYGTTLTGGTNGLGTVFELIHSNGGWTEKVLHNFNYNGTDGFTPLAGLIFDKAGNLYGTTVGGGSNGWGTVFELTPSNGSWTETILNNFSNFDGSSPTGGLIFDNSGNLYGTTLYGGTNSDGTVFELTPSNGSWTETVLHSFTGSDGMYPDTYHAALIFDKAGNLYGTTEEGGSNGYGTVFELKPSNGRWTESVLHSFPLTAGDGSSPLGGLIFDNSGNLYGTTLYGGTNSDGTVFELTPSNGSWSETILHSFTYDDGSEPAAALIFDNVGNLYGTTNTGGSNGYGTAFKIDTTNQETVLQSFGAGTDGKYVQGSSLVMDSTGNLYGTTSGGGTANDGVVFEITPLSLLFPVKQPGALPQYTLKNLPITSVFDHSMANAYECGGGGWGVVTAFTTESASSPVTDLAFGCGTTKTPLYGRSNPSIPSFLEGYNYQQPRSVLYYDGHPGYDYKFGSSTPLYPAISGCVTYSQPAAGVTAAKGHVLAIIPQPSSPLGGCQNILKNPQYSIVYMHLSSYYDGQQVMRCSSFDQETGACLTSAPCPTCAQQGEWVSTDRADPIGYPGNFLVTNAHPEGWGGVPFHLHFEVDKIIDGKPVPLDPYGWCGAPGTDPYTKLTMNVVPGGLVNTTLWDASQFTLTCPTFGQ
jgi:uncharacterized repeat protein (TIGR03803 family)